MIVTLLCSVVGGDALAPPVSSPSASNWIVVAEGPLKKPRPEDKQKLAEWVWSSGFNDIARQIRRPTSPTDNAAWMNLAKTLMARGEILPAASLLDQWQRADPRNEIAPLARAALFLNMGDTELFGRELERLRTPPKGYEAFVARMNEIALANRRKAVVTPENNPWKVKFQSETGEFTPGSLAEAEAKKIPENAVEGLMSVLEFAPRQGNLWALLGELLNARGEIQAALDCFRLAEDVLEYRSPMVRAHRRQLADFQKRKAAESESALDQAMTATGASSSKGDAVTLDDFEKEGGWATITSRPRVLIVLLGAGAGAAGLLFLQIRQWLSRSKR